jgi:hypothetical protein
MRFAGVGVLVMAGLLASCSAAHVRPGAQSRAGTQSKAGTQPVGIGAPAHVQATTGARLQIGRGPWWSQGAVTPCGPPALVRAAGHVLGAGCGQFSSPPLKVTLAVGQQVDVHMSLGALPHSSRPSVLAPGAMTGNGATQTYRAGRPGQAVLSSGSRACLIFRHPQARRPTTRTCPVVAVTVVP